MVVKNDVAISLDPHVLVVMWPVTVDRFKQKTLDESLTDFKQYVEHAFQKQVSVHYFVNTHSVYWTQQVEHNRYNVAVELIDDIAHQFAKRAELGLGKIIVHRQIADPFVDPTT